jgi:hypothetical protein
MFDAVLHTANFIAPHEDSRAQNEAKHAQHNIKCPTQESASHTNQCSIQSFASHASTTLQSRSKIPARPLKFSYKLSAAHLLNNPPPTPTPPHPILFRFAKRVLPRIAPSPISPSYLNYLHCHLKQEYIHDGTQPASACMHSYN